MMETTELQVKITETLRKNKDRWFSTRQIWIRFRKYSYTHIAFTLKKLREANSISFDKYQDLKKGNQFENIYRYKEDALDDIIV